MWATQCFTDISAKVTKSNLRHLTIPRQFCPTHTRDCAIPICASNLCDFQHSFPCSVISCFSTTPCSPGRCAEPRSVEGLDGVLQECVATFCPFDKKSTRTTPAARARTCCASARCSRTLLEQGIEKWERRTIAINTSALLSSESKTKKSRRWKSF